MVNIDLHKQPHPVNDQVLVHFNPFWVHSTHTTIISRATLHLKVLTLKPTNAEGTWEASGEV